MEISSETRLPGPNRRSDRPIIEYRLHFSPDVTGLNSWDDHSLLQAINSQLPRLDCSEDFDFDRASSADNPLSQAWQERISRRLAQLTLHLQQQAGHQVSEYGVVRDTEGPVWVWFEYDHTEVGERATQLSLRMIRSALALVAPESGFSQDPVTEIEIAEFLEFSRQRKMSAETRALMAAARRRGIPCFNLDRYPYEPLVGDFRIRPNGLLRLGHACYQYVMDGTLCVNWNPTQIAALRDRHSMRTQLQAAGVPVAAADIPASGGRYRVLVIGGKAAAVLCQSDSVETSAIHPAICIQIEAVFRRFKLPIFAAQISTSDISQDLAETNGSWLDLDLAPDLETWFPEGGDALQRAADLLLAQLYPEGSKYRIPIVSVTGTNGKTTTCTMIGHIMQAAEITPVVVASTGVTVSQRRQGDRSEFGPASAYYALESSDARVAVFEDYFGSIIRFGFAYEWSDVAVCTNVTADHLHRRGTHTLEQLAEVKFAPIKRARKGAVLFADNEYCAAMLSRSGAPNKVAVSLLKNRSALAQAHPEATHFCTLETESGQQFIVLYDGEVRHSLLAVDDIPASMQGHAIHNISNAMHAAAAAWLLGVAPVVISAALRTFACSFETCKGRLNEFRGLPFRVLMDYGHNADGFRLISAFIDTQKVSGRKIMMTAFSSDRRESEVLDAARQLAGHFDHYVFRNFRLTREVVTEAIPQVLRQGLLQSGVSADAITVLEDAREALDFTLQFAQPGDLVLLFVGSSEFDMVWRILGEIRAGLEAQSARLT